MKNGPELIQYAIGASCTISDIGKVAKIKASPDLYSVALNPKVTPCRHCRILYIRPSDPKFLKSNFFLSFCGGCLDSGQRETSK
jgi:hypothetical protein